jgi:hypothetical protein
MKERKKVILQSGGMKTQGDIKKDPALERQREAGGQDQKGMQSITGDQAQAGDQGMS